MKLLAVLWALLAVAFVATGVAIWENRERWPRLLLIVSAASILLLAPALLATGIGIAIDVLLIVVALRAGAVGAKVADN